MPGPNFKIILEFFDIFRNGIKEMSFYGRQGAFNYIRATSVITDTSPLKSYEQVTRVIKKYNKFEYTDGTGTHFLIVKSKLYK